MKEIFEKFNRITYVCILTQQNTINALPLEDLFRDLTDNERKAMKKKLDIKYIKTEFASKKRWEEGFQQVFKEKYSDNLSSVTQYETILFEKSGKKILEKLIQLSDPSDEAVSKTALIINIGGGQKQHAIGLYAATTAYSIQNNTMKPTIIICYPDATKYQRITTWEYIFDSSSQLLDKESKEEVLIHTKFNSSLSVEDICHLTFSRGNLRKSIKFDHREISIEELKEIQSLLDHPELRRYYFQRMAASSRYNYYKNDRNWTQDISLEEAFQKLHTKKDLIWDVFLGGSKLEKISIEENEDVLTILKSGRSAKDLFFDAIDRFIGRSWRTSWANIIYSKNSFEFIRKSPKGFNLPIGSFELDTHQFKTIFNPLPRLLDKISIGTYFELLVLQKLHIFKERHPANLIREILYNFSVNIGGQKFLEYDIAVSTTYGSLLIIECKSNRMSTQAASAAIQKAQDLGGIYVEYICVIPTIDSTDDTEIAACGKTAHRIWKNHEALTTFKRSTYFLKNKGDDDTKEWDRQTLHSFEYFLKENLIEK